ncbi:MAG: hypothetical protein AAF689_18610 [Pseudomonadota bacterium]
MRKFCQTFFEDESGAISVDWIVLTVGVVCLGCLAVLTAQDGTFGLADSIRNVTSETGITPAAVTDR